MTTLNYDDYKIVLQARKSKKFRELDDKVRSLAVEIGRGEKKESLAEYKKLAAERDQMLKDYAASIQPAPVAFDDQLLFKLEPKVTKTIQAFVNKFPLKKNLIFLGATGTGKTYSAKYITQALQQKGFLVHFITTFNLYNRLNDSLYGRDAEAQDDFFLSNLLIIDDLGAEPSMKNSDDLIYTVINERYANDKPFIITTNLSREQIANRYDQRIFGRLFDKNKTVVLNFNGKDLRLE